MLMHRRLAVAEIPFGLRKTIETSDGSYDRDVATAVLERVGDGLTLVDSCTQLGLPPRWVRAWVLENADGMAERYAQARRMQAESWADVLVAVADDATDDDAQTAKLRIDTRKWLMGKNSERFSDKSTLVHEGSKTNPVVYESADEVRRELAARGIPVKTVYGNVNVVPIKVKD